MKYSRTPRLSHARQLCNASSPPGAVPIMKRTFNCRMYSLLFFTSCSRGRRNACTSNERRGSGAVCGRTQGDFVTAT
jgi:hypothetical protein